MCLRSGDGPRIYWRKFAELPTDRNCLSIRSWPFSFWTRYGSTARPCGARSQPNIAADWVSQKKGPTRRMSPKTWIWRVFATDFKPCLHIKAEGGRPEQFVFTFAGFIAANGMNSRSIGICANPLSQLRHGREGLPVACVIRGALERTTLNDAIQFLKQVKHASGQNYILGGGDRVYDFECSAGKVVSFTPTSDTGVVYHTNHPLANDDYDAEYADSRDPAKTGKGDSQIR